MAARSYDYGQFSKAGWTQDEGGLWTTPEGMKFDEGSRQFYVPTKDGGYAPVANPGTTGTAVPKLYGGTNPGAIHASNRAAKDALWNSIKDQTTLTREQFQGVSNPAAMTKMRSDLGQFTDVVKAVAPIVLAAGGGMLLAPAAGAGAASFGQAAGSAGAMFGAGSPGAALAAGAGSAIGGATGAARNMFGALGPGTAPGGIEAATFPGALGGGLSTAPGVVAGSAGVLPANLSPYLTGILGGGGAGAGGSMFGALGGVAKNYALDQLKGMAQEKIMGALMPKPKQPAPVTPSYGLAGPSRLGPAIEPPAAQPYQGLGWAPRKSNNPFTALAATLRNRAG